MSRGFTFENFKAKLAKVLAEAGWQVSKRHRELERRGTSLPLEGISGETGVGRG